MSKKKQDKSVPEAAYYAQFPNARSFMERDVEDDNPLTPAPHPEKGDPVDIRQLMTGEKSPPRKTLKTPLTDVMDDYDD